MWAKELQNWASFNHQRQNSKSIETTRMLFWHSWDLWFVDSATVQKTKISNMLPVKPLVSILITWHKHNGTLPPHVSLLSVIKRDSCKVWIQETVLHPQQVWRVTVTRILIKGSACCGKALPHCGMFASPKFARAVLICRILLLFSDIIREI